MNVRLRPGRIPIPDLIVTDPVNLDELMIDAAEVHLVCEIVSSSNASTDKVLKMHYYAAAGIEWYLLVEQKTGVLRLHRRRGRHYTEHSATKRGETLRLTEPVRATIRPEDLVP